METKIQKGMRFEKVSLGTYVQVVGGFAFKSEDFSDEGIPVVRISDIRNDSVSVIEAARISNEKAGRGQAYCVEPGDILIAMSGATTGKIGIVPDDCVQPILQNQRVGRFKIVDPNKIYKKYLKHYLVSSSYQSQIWQSMVGVAQPNISSKQLEQIEVPLPSIAEQKRIAAILDKAEELRGLRRQALRELDAIAQSTFLEMFGDPVANEKGWRSARIAEFVAAFETGKNIVAEDEDDIVSSYRVLKVSAVTSLEYRPNESKAIPSDYQPPASHFVHAGDLLFSSANTTELIGATAYVFKTPQNLLLPDKIWRFVWHEEPKADPLFVWFLFRHSAFRYEVGKRATGTSGSMKNISQEKVFSLRVGLPPLSLQQEFAHRVKVIEQLKATHRESLAHLDTLFASLQHRAFRGEL